MTPRASMYVLEEISNSSLETSPVVGRNMSEMLGITWFIKHNMFHLEFIVIIKRCVYATFY